MEILIDRCGNRHAVVIAFMGGYTIWREFVHYGDAKRESNNLKKMLGLDHGT